MTLKLKVSLAQDIPLNPPSKGDFAGSSQLKKSNVRVKIGISCVGIFLSSGLKQISKCKFAFCNFHFSFLRVSPDNPL
jgi:hypothetical protein